MRFVRLKTKLSGGLFRTFPRVLNGVTIAASIKEPLPWRQFLCHNLRKIISFQLKTVRRSVHVYKKISCYKHTPLTSHKNRPFNADLGAMHGDECISGYRKFKTSPSGAVVDFKLQHHWRIQGKSTTCSNYHRISIYITNVSLSGHEPIPSHYVISTILVAIATKWVPAISADLCRTTNCITKQRYILALDNSVSKIIFLIYCELQFRINMLHSTSLKSLTKHNTVHYICASQN
jgi:hypothetical protein